jgi:CheY-like chemotaxis protein
LSGYVQPPGRPTVLVIHDDGDALDLLTRVFEADGFEVVPAVTGFRAQAHLEGDRQISVVVVPWEAARAVGGEVYRWSLQHRYDLRDRFVFLAAEVPAEFDRLVGGRCLTVPPADPAAIVRVARGTVRQLAQLDAARGRALVGRDAGKPTLLLAEDDPTLLMVMGDLLADAGYEVTRVEGGRAATRTLDGGDFDAIVADLRMDGGGAAELLRWIAATRPHLAERVVFLVGEEGGGAGAVAMGRPIFRKGADSRGLVQALREIVRRVRGEPPP